MITNYETLPLGTYLDILDIPKMESEVDYQVAVVAKLAGMTEDQVLDLPLEKYKALAAASRFLTAPVLSKDGRTPFDGKRCPDSFTLGGTVLMLTKSPKDMVVAQYVDFQNFAKAEGAMPALLSCLLIPNGKTYNEGYDIAEVQRLIRENLPTSDAYAISAFFLRKFALFIRGTLTSSRLDLMKKRKRTEKENRVLQETTALLRSLKGGDGLRTLMRSLNSPAAAGTMSGASALSSSSTSSPTGTTR